MLAAKYTEAGEKGSVHIESDTSCFRRYQKDELVSIGVEVVDSLSSSIV
jgi:hypothetical protein